MVKSKVAPPLLAAATAGAASIGVAGTAVAGAVAVTTGYVVYRTQKALLGGITKKFKISLLKGQLMPPALIVRSARIIRHIKGGQVPSSIEIARPMALALTAKMTRFKPS